MAQVRSNPAVLNLVNPIQLMGTISVSSDFPTSADVQFGWTYRVLVDVTDNDVTKTNTGDSFEEGDEIMWNGSNWTIIGVEIWKRDGTIISPRTVGDVLDIVSHSFKVYKPFHWEFKNHARCPREC